MNNRIVMTNVPLTRNGQTAYFSCFARLEDSKLTDLRLFHQDDSSMIGNIYVARVDSIAPNIHAIFLKISPDMKVYLPDNEIEEAIFTKKISEKKIVIGDELLVQITRDPIKTKLATCSTHLCLTGNYCVVSTFPVAKGVSKKIKGPRKKEIQELLENEESIKFGVVARTNSETIDDSILISEINKIHSQLQNIVEKASYQQLYQCIYEANSNAVTFIKNQYHKEVEEIVTDSKSLYGEIEQFCQGEDYFDGNDISLRLYDNAYSLNALYSLSHQIEGLLGKKVWLKSGAYLVIDPTEALTVIDVNSGKNTKKDKGDYFLNINKEAATEIAKQLILRNLSGIIVIDFIDLKSKEQQQELIEHLRKELAKDHITCSYVDMTKLNLVEITRKKTSSPLHEIVSNYFSNNA